MEVFNLAQGQQYSVKGSSHSREAEFNGGQTQQSVRQSTGVEPEQ